jgi:YVTN family beta-propeller protein
MRRILIILGILLLVRNFNCQGQTDGSNYKIVNRFPVEGDGGWDYLAMDENTGRLFISHGMITQVIDSKTGKLLGTIEDTKGVHGIALDRKDNKAFISCGKDSTVTIINLTTLEFICKVKITGANPDAILYDDFSEKVFVYNGRSSNATVIDAKTNAVVSTIPLPGKPEFSVSDGKGKVYVNIEDKSQISVIDAINLKVENTWPIALREEPSGLALDNTTHRLFSVCGNKKMVVLDALNGKVISVLEIGEWVDGCAFDPELKRAYSSNGEGTVTVVQEKSANEFVVLETIQTMRGARTLCLDKITHHIYLPTAEYGPAPEPTADNPHPRPIIKSGTFIILDIAPGINDK